MPCSAGLGSSAAAGLTDDLATVSMCVCVYRAKRVYLINGADMCPTCPDGVHVPADGCGKLDQTGSLALCLFLSFSVSLSLARSLFLALSRAFSRTVFPCW
jgi:hypothetical protein